MAESSLGAGARLAYLDALRPPDGYELEGALGTTYSLHLEALVAALVALAGIAEDDSRRPLARLRALDHDTRGRVVVATQQGRTALGASPRTSPLYALLDRVVRDVPFDTAERSFHPKVWVIRYSRPENRDTLRLLVMSRNLTADRSWDLGIAAEGVSGVVGDALAGDVAAFVDEVVASAGLKDEDAIRRLRGDGLAAVRWTLPPGLDAGRLRFRIGGEASFVPTRLAEANDVLVVSPFVDASGLRRIATAAQKVLVSTVNALTDLSRTRAGHRVLAGWSTYAMLSPEAHDLESDATADPANEEAPPDVRGLGLHAKLCAVTRPDRCDAWLGSANATGRGFDGRNAEAVLAFSASREFTQSLHAWVAAHAERWILPPVPPESEPPKTCAIDAARTALSAGAWTLDRTAERSRLAVDPRLRVPAGVRVYVGRATVAGEEAWPSDAASVALPPCRPHEETELLLVRLETDDDEVVVVVRAVATPPIGRERDAAVLRAQLGAYGWLKYLRSLLDPDDVGAAGDGDGARGGGGIGNGATAQREDLGLTFEALLRRGAQGGDEWLADIDREVSHYTSGLDGDDVLQEEDRALVRRFTDFWRTFKAGYARYRR